MRHRCRVAVGGSVAAVLAPSSNSVFVVVSLDLGSGQVMGTHNKTASKATDLVVMSRKVNSIIFTFEYVGTLDRSL
jgi:hypothetical protein